MTSPRRVVVMGVAGSGKSTVGRLVAEQHGSRFLEGDDFHPASNVAKMAAGQPLTDDDRWPWLAELCQAMRTERDVVVTCSALKRRYRDVLRGAEYVCFVYLVISPEAALRRVAARHGHFMGRSMVASQFEVLEVPGPDETDVAAIDAERDVCSVVSDADRALETLQPLSRPSPPPGPVRPWCPAAEGGFR